MEVAKPMADDFKFNNSTLLSYTSAPSSPRPFGNPSDFCNYCASAPASPRRSAADLYNDLLYDENDDSNASDAFEFALGFSGQLDKNGCPNSISQSLASADELFEHGKIRPLNPRDLREDFSGDGSSREYKRDVRRAARSLSPMRSETDPNNSMNSPSVTKKWRLKDLFLFRSASEGRATGRGSKDPLLKYTLLSSSPSSSTPSVFLRPFSKKKASQAEGRKEEQNNTASSPTILSKKGSGRRVGVHELHYSAGRAAVMEEMKKKTPLAYHHNSMFSCLRLNPAASHQQHSMMSRVPSRSSHSRN